MAILLNLVKHRSPHFTVVALCVGKEGFGLFSAEKLF